MYIKLIILSMLLACGVTEPARVQIGGDEIISGDDPLHRYTVAIKLVVSSKDRFSHGGCSGTLLSNQHVLLAAHCVDNVHGAKVLVGYDNKVITDDEQEFSAVGVGKSFVVSKSFLARGGKKMFAFLRQKFHPFATPRTIVKDIAVIELEQPLPLPYSIDFDIPPPDRNLSGEQVTLAGYGIGNFGQQPMIGRKSTIKLARDYRGSDLLEFVNYFSNINFGDSGGPVWWRNEEGRLKLIGVHSFKFPMIRNYTWSIDIRQHRKWINNARQALRQKDFTITAAMDMSKRYFAAYLEKNYREQ